MKYLIPILKGVFILVLNILFPVTWLFAAIATLSIKWDKEEKVGPQRTNPPTPTIMGDVRLFKFMQTPDQRLPCDTGISECKAMLDKYGKWLTAWNWMGIRNTWGGLAVALGRPTTGYIPEDVEGLWERDDVWTYRKTFSKGYFYCGYTAFAMLDGTFMAAPFLTWKKRK